ncbi:MAG: hypothetical protein IIU93_05800 [Alistipes sp.]|nr:hypothetical protein [Alistipes sp.]
MKKYLSILTLIALIACNSNQEYNFTKGVTIKASTSQTRTSFDGSISAWDANDKLQVAIGATGEAPSLHEFTNSDPSNGLFTNADLTLDNTLTYDIFALYSTQGELPDVTNRNAAVAIGAAVQEQTGASAAHIAALDPLYGSTAGAQSNNIAVNMKHSATVLRITIKNTTGAEIAGVKSLKISTADDIQLHGTGTIDFTTREVTMGSDGSNSITINIQDSGVIAADGEFTVWAAAAPFTMAENSAMHFTLTTADDKVLEYKKEFAASTDFEAGVIMSTTIAPEPRPEQIVIQWGYLDGYTAPVGMPSCETDVDNLVNEIGITNGSYPTKYGNITIDSAVKFAYVSNSNIVRFKDVTANDNAYIYLPTIPDYKLTQVIASIPSNLVGKRATLRIAIDPAASTTAKNTNVQDATFNLANTSSDQQYKIHIYGTNTTKASYDLTGIQLTYILE